MVCNNFDLPYDESMLCYSTRKADCRQKQENINTNRKPDATISSKWRNQLTKRQIINIENVAVKELEKLGYMLEEDLINLTVLGVSTTRYTKRSLGDSNFSFNAELPNANPYFNKFGNNLPHLLSYQAND